MTLTSERLRGAIEYIAGAADEVHVALLSLHVDGTGVSVQVSCVGDVDLLAHRLGLPDDGTVASLHVRIGQQPTYGYVDVFASRKGRQ